MFSKRQKKFISHFALRPRINSSSLSIKNSEHNYRDITFDSKISFGFGLEFEFILPFNKNKWAITIEPTYQNYKTNITTDSNSPNKGTITGISDYSSIEIPLSLRHYFFLKNDSKLFINTSFVLDYDLKSSLTIITTNISGVSNTPYSIKSRGNIAFGFGYKYNNKLGIELRYSMSRNILGNYVFYDSNYKTASLILGYSLF